MISYFKNLIMQKFILIRGHQGSGKSTFAKQIVQDFAKIYPDAIIAHLENDILLTDRHGHYHWSPERLDDAQRQNLAKFKQLIQYGQQHRTKDILIINSNTNQKTANCLNLIHLAKQSAFDVQIYRLHNFFDNVHDVPMPDVLLAYIRLNHNPLPDEIHLAPICPPNDEISTTLNQMQNLHDERSSITDGQNIVVGKIGKKQSMQYPKLFVLQSTNHVFCQGAFNHTPFTMCNLVMDDYQTVIIRPCKKTLDAHNCITNNRLQRPIYDDDNLNVIAQVDGFLGTCTYVALMDDHPNFHANFNHQVLYATTDSLDDDFAKITKSHCAKYEPIFKKFANHTFLFKITSFTHLPTSKKTFDKTLFDAMLIGIINIKTGTAFDEKMLDDIAQSYGLNRPDVFYNICFDKLKTILKNTKYAGFMAFDHQWQPLFLVKSTILFNQSIS